MSFSMNDGDDDAPVSDINVTPLVDVMLVLLIVFMITMPVLTHSIQIQLPTASVDAQSEEEQKPKEPMWLSVDDSGQYFIDRSSTPTAKENLASAFAEAVARNPDVVLAVDASKDVDYGTVIQAIDMAKEAKIKKIGFNTEIKSVAPPQ
ncbi:ExbD/TolR family protein [Neisseria sp. WLZKY-1]|uniref:ExbD/TolR family protein n=1 Tax=unclassified Neisseria TaxID=2623750 RepID=UPI0002A2610C|nr:MULTISPECIES: biopolymer transporter ExbD [unclassified Neisseria]ASP16449.1 biopolymer transporter ExbD [Neisseria sp. KEM232]EKY06144.1 transport energizing protein, ExbD/TolR family [Neisseria sp. oral taxon 020 str. F0370]